MTTSREQMERMRYEAEQTQARLREQGQEAAYKAQSGAESMKHNIASGLHSTAQTVRSQSKERGQAGLATRLADPLDRSAQYLDTHSLPQISQDAGTYARQHPITAAVGVFAATFLLGRLLRRR
ncbi:MAG TPA: hypothetical protein PLJ35_12575 [Anaerolineae bacterium]|mgnify:CR=1 FL=1|nr:hypothetical protein [Anaerolineae bacterium]HOQ99646.1 hypothetical protein [Anaerolineae bacterium]HPL26769.1 hypothetical protein [Anaerolineae bacterium]